MNTIPLINNIPKSKNVGNIGGNETQLRQEINTSLVALKKEAGTLEGLINEAAQMLVTINNRIATLEKDTVKKSDVVDVVQSGNLQPVTSNAVADKISSLDVSSVGGSGKYISAISETDGKINATATDLGNMVPVNSVTNDDMHSVTSNRIFKCFGLNNVYNEWYSAGRYSSGFIKLGSTSYTTDGNHDVALCGTSFYSNATNICVMYFTCYIRGRGSTVSVKTFTTHRIGGDNLATLRCTYEISGNTFKINLWGMISSWARFIVKFNGVFSGDVITPSSSVDTSNAVATSMTGTEISATVI